jgi:hypothetical protein
MNAPEPVGSETPPAGSTSASKSPDVQSLLQHYRTRERARRQQRKRRTVITAGVALGGIVLFVIALRVGLQARGPVVSTPEPAAPSVAVTREPEPEALRPQEAVAPPTADPRASRDRPPAGAKAGSAEKPPASSKALVGETPADKAAAEKPLADRAAADKAPAVATAPAAAKAPPVEKSPTADKASPAAVDKEASSSPRVPPVTVRYPPRERLSTVRPGDAKERVFEIFGSTVERRNGTLVRIEGMRLRANGRSPEHPRVEVAEVEVADSGPSMRYWFLFGDDRLVAWGRPDEWAAAVARYQLDIDYR